MDKPSESTLEAEIPRSSRKLEREELLRLISLNEKQPWLIRKQAALLQLWDLCTSTEEQSLIANLLTSFTYLDGAQLEDSLKKLAQTIIRDWKLNAHDTVIVAMNDEAGADSSKAILQQIKREFSGADWRETNFIDGLPEAMRRTRDYRNIVLVDEFCGTGDTVTRKVNWLRKAFDNEGVERNVFVAFVAAMEIARPVLTSLALRFFSVHWLKKGISEKFANEEREQATTQMVRLESELLDKHGARKLPKFGYKGSEALYASDAGNVPNNVFPIFWWPWLKSKIVRETLLRRL